MKFRCSLVCVVCMCFFLTGCSVKHISEDPMDSPENPCKAPEPSVKPEVKSEPVPEMTCFPFSGISVKCRTINWIMER